jgi:two-component system, chemotaxis family, chemotaxis protein CheY
LKNALVVEDSAIMRGIITSSLAAFPDINLIEVSSGFDALKALPQREYDVILTDINMPDINGLELLHFIKTNPQYKSIPVIIISTEKSEADRDRGLAMGADAYLTKPFTPKDLEVIVRKLLRL